MQAIATAIFVTVAAAAPAILPGFLPARWAIETDGAAGVSCVRSGDSDTVAALSVISTPGGYSVNARIMNATDGTPLFDSIFAGSSVIGCGMTVTSAASYFWYVTDSELGSTELRSFNTWRQAANSSNFVGVIFTGASGFARLATGTVLQFTPSTRTMTSISVDAANGAAASFAGCSLVDINRVACLTSTAFCVISGQTHDSHCVAHGYLASEPIVGLSTTGTLAAMTSASRLCTLSLSLQTLGAPRCTSPADLAGTTITFFSFAANVSLGATPATPRTISYLVTSTVLGAPRTHYLGFSVDASGSVTSAWQSPSPSFPGRVVVGALTTFLWNGTFLYVADDFTSDDVPAASGPEGTGKLSARYYMVDMSSGYVTSNSSLYAPTPPITDNGQLNRYVFLGAAWLGGVGGTDSMTLLKWYSGAHPTASFNACIVLTTWSRPNAVQTPRGHVASADSLIPSGVFPSYAQKHDNPVSATVDSVAFAIVLGLPSGRVVSVRPSDSVPYAIGAVISQPFTTKPAVVGTTLVAATASAMYAWHIDNGTESWTLPELRVIPAASCNLLAAGPRWIFFATTNNSVATVDRWTGLSGPVLSHPRLTRSPTTLVLDPTSPETQPIVYVTAGVNDVFRIENINVNGQALQLTAPVASLPSEVSVVSACSFLDLYVFCSTTNGQVVRLSKTSWSTQIAPGVIVLPTTVSVDRPLVTAHNRVYAVDAGVIRALDSSSSNVTVAFELRTSLPGESYATVFDYRGGLYAVTSIGTFLRFRDDIRPSSSSTPAATGTSHYTFQLQPECSSTSRSYGAPAISPSGILILVSECGATAVDSQVGRQLWNTSAIPVGCSSPTVGGGGIVYVSCPPVSDGSARLVMLDLLKGSRYLQSPDFPPQLLSGFWVAGPDRLWPVVAVSSPQASWLIEMHLSRPLYTSSQLPPPLPDDTVDQIDYATTRYYLLAEVGVAWILVISTCCYVQVRDARDVKREGKDIHAGSADHDDLYAPMTAE